MDAAPVDVVEDMVESVVRMGKADCDKETEATTNREDGTPVGSTTAKEEDTDEKTGATAAARGRLTASPTTR